MLLNLKAVRKFKNIEQHFSLKVDHVGTAVMLRFPGELLKSHATFLVYSSGRGVTVSSE